MPHSLFKLFNEEKIPNVLWFWLLWVLDRRSIRTRLLKTFKNRHRLRDIFHYFLKFDRQTKIYVNKKHDEEIN